MTKRQKEFTIGACVLALIISIPTYIIYQEQKPEYQDHVVDTGIVTAAGCVNSQYKGLTQYDCSVAIDMFNEGPIKIIMKIGVLPGDFIDKYCGRRYNRPEYRCWYGR